MILSSSRTARQVRAYKKGVRPSIDAHIERRAYARGSTFVGRPMRKASGPPPFDDALTRRRHVPPYLRFCARKIGRAPLRMHTHACALRRGWLSAGGPPSLSNAPFAHLTRHAFSVHRPGNILLLYWVLYAVLPQRATLRRNFRVFLWDIVRHHGHAVRVQLFPLRKPRDKGAQAAGGLVDVQAVLRLAHA